MWHVSESGLARGGAWQVLTARGRRVAARGARAREAETSGGTWGRV